MKEYLCESAEIVMDVEKKKNPYIRLTFADATIDIENDPFAAALVKKVVIVVSGGFFTADNKPDMAKNYDWCQKMAPIFEGRKTLLHEFQVTVEPYYKLGADGQPTGGVLTTIGVTTFAQAGADGQPIPLLGEASVNNQGRNRLANGTSMYKTVAQIEAEKQIAAQIGGVSVLPQQPPVNPFANVGEVSNPYA